jgi:hypothetical protein
MTCSNWICAAKARHGKTRNPELTVLLMRCERLALLPVKAHFVFDGKERPRLKRDKNVRGTDHWSAGPFKSILDIFGFSHSEVGPPGIPFYGLLTSFLVPTGFGRGRSRIGLHVASRGH